MKYFSVTLLVQGRKRQEIIQAHNSIESIKSAKKKFPLTINIKSV